MRVIFKEELPAGPFLVKLPGSPWFKASLEDTAHTFLVKAHNTPYSEIYSTKAVQDAALEDWSWNTTENEATAKSFIVSEPGDADLRKLLKAAGTNFKSIRVTCKDGSVIEGKLADFPHTKGQLDFQLRTPIGIRRVIWFEVANIVLTPGELDRYRHAVTVDFSPKEKE